MRRAVEEASHDHERWLVSYADFITLLFAFFVVMYSVSSVNEGKYRVLTETLEGIFNKTQPKLGLGRLEDQWDQGHSASDHVVRKILPGDYNADEDYRYGVPGEEKPPEAGGALTGSLGEDALAEINAQIQAQFSDLVALGEIRLTGNEAWIEVDIKSNILFASGQATPSEVAEDLLTALAGILSDKPNPVHVEGFTDNIPIQNDRFPSNWELSTARASAVLRLLVEGGVAPARMAAVGYGQYQPIASNETAEGRRKNRRVVLVISKSLGVRRSASTQNVSALAERASENAAEQVLGLQMVPGDLNADARNIERNNSGAGSSLEIGNTSEIGNRSGTAVAEALNTETVRVPTQDIEGAAPSP